MKNKFLIVSIAALSMITALVAPSLIVSSQDNNDIQTVADTSDYYSSITDDMTGDTLLSALRSLNSTKRTKTVGYGGMASAYRTTDVDPDNPNNIYSFYSGVSVPFDGNFYSDTSPAHFNREHVWCKSHGGNLVEGDVHMTRPTICSENSSRGNSYYVEGMASQSAGWDPYTDSPSADTLASRGSSARIIFYCVVANSSLSLEDTTSASGSNKMGKLSDMLKWNRDTAIQVREGTRNEAAQVLQGNRNPFIDHPEYACRIWGNTNSTTQSICAAAPVSSLKLMVNGSEAGSSQNIRVGNSLTFTAQLDGSATTSVSWASSNTSVASISNGVVSGLSNGTSTISATYTLDTTIKASCSVTVSDGKVTSISVSPTSKSLDINKTATYTATVLPNEATDKSVTWSSSNTNVATITSSGVVTTLAYGTTTIKATANDGSGIVGSSTLTVEAVTSYNLVTDLSQLVDDSKVVIGGVSGSTYYALGSQNANNRAAVVSTVSDNAMTPGSGFAELTLGSVNVGGTKYYTFNDGAGYLYAASSGNNYLRIESAVTANSEWSITITDGVFSISSVGNTSRGVMQLNDNSATNVLFSCYATASIKAVQLYIKSSSPTPAEEAAAYATNFLTATEDCTTSAAGVWAAQKSAYQALSTDAQAVLTNATYSGAYADATDTQKCVWRYDLAVAQQALENFMSRAALSASGAQLTNNLENYNDSIIIIVIAGIVGISAIAITVVITKKRRA